MFLPSYVRLELKWLWFYFSSWPYHLLFWKVWNRVCLELWPLRIAKHNNSTTYSTTQCILGVFLLIEYYIDLTCIISSTVHKYTDFLITHTILYCRLWTHHKNTFLKLTKLSTKISSQLANHLYKFLFLSLQFTIHYVSSARLVFIAALKLKWLHICLPVGKLWMKHRLIGWWSRARMVHWFRTGFLLLKI